jgi:hypothetical protein
VDAAGRRERAELQADVGENILIMGGSYRADHRGWLFNLLWPFMRYAFTNLTVIVLGIPLFFIFNQTRIIGRKRVPQQRNTLLLSNHQSMIDSFLVGIGAYFPQSLVKPYLIPWNPASSRGTRQRRRTSSDPGGWVFSPTSGSASPYGPGGAIREPCTG